MAKRTSRILLKWQCSVCGRQNYTSEKNKINTPDKLALRKYCRACRKHTEHKENLKTK